MLSYNIGDLEESLTIRDDPDHDSFLAVGAFGRDHPLTDLALDE
jgi:hypothetical protein